MGQTGPFDFAVGEANVGGRQLAVPLAHPALDLVQKQIRIATIRIGCSSSEVQAVWCGK